MVRRRKKEKSGEVRTSRGWGPALVARPVDVPVAKTRHARRWGEGGTRRDELLSPVAARRDRWLYM
jgi:hypothetical protein